MSLDPDMFKVGPSLDFISICTTGVLCVHLFENANLFEDNLRVVFSYPK